MKAVLLNCLALGAVGALGATPCPVFESLARDSLQKHSRFTGTAFADTVPYTLESSGDSKHTPYMVVANGVATITVGLGTVSGNPDDKIHPTTASSDPASVHFIERLYAQDQDGMVIALAELTASTERPSLSFAVPAGTTSIKPFSLCNKHGLWEGAVTSVAAEDATAVHSCEMAQCGTNAVGLVDGVCAQFAAVEGNALREHAAMFGTSTPFAPTETNTKHTPYVTVTGTTAMVTVGLGTVTQTPADLIHPTGADYASWPEASIHYISMLYVKNQDGAVVAASHLVPAGRPELVFDIPAGTTSLTAFSMCNTHGLFEGYTLTVTTEAAADGAVAPCGLTACGGSRVKRVRCDMFETFRAEAVRKHHQERGDEVAVFTPDETNLKHTPFYTVTNTATATTVTVTVGRGTVSGDAADPIHPTSPDSPHFIELIYAVDQNDVVVAMTQLTATTERPSLTFDVPAGTTSLTAYSLCNKHGLYTGSPLALTTGSSSEMVCALTSGCEDVNAPSDCTAVDTLVGEAERIQASHYGQAEAFAPTDANLKHTPYITIAGTTATVTVGLGTVTGKADDPVHKNSHAWAHFIETLYVKNQDGVVVAVGKLAPVLELPSLTFDIPAGTTSLTAYSLCNKHGLYVSAAYDVAEAQRGAGAARCMLASCGGAPTGEAACGVFDSLRADSLRLHALVHGGSATPFAPVDGDAHTPVLSAAGGRAQVTMPSFAGANGAFIRRLFVENQHGVVVAMSEMLGTAPPTLEFDIPTGATSLTAYAARNTGGVSASAAVSVARTSGTPRVCRLASCNEDVMSTDGTCELFASIDAHARAQHLILRNMSEPFTPSDANLKHTPFVSLKGSFATVSVGSGTVDGVGPIHPMSPSADASAVHYIELVYAKNQDGMVVAAHSLTPHDDNRLTFEVPAGTTSLTAYSWCNKHGLYEGAAVAVDAKHRSANAAVRCGTARCGGAVGSASVCPAFEALRGDAMVQHEAYQTDAAMYGPGVNPKHTPYFQVIGEEARVVVGLGAVSNTPGDLVHVGRVTTDPAMVHVIQRIWVVNQHDAVVAMVDLPQTAAAAPALSFTIPRGTTSMTAYSLCQPHGLFKSHVFAVDAPLSLGAPARTCDMQECQKDPVGYNATTATCQEFELLKAEALAYGLKKTGSAAPATAESEETPVLTVVNGQGHVTLGAPALAKVNPSADAARYLTFPTVYVENQDGRVVAAGKVGPFDEFKFTFSFENSTTALTPFVLSTATGVHQGATVALAAHGACFMQGCASLDVPASSEECFFAALHAECLRRHKLIRPEMEGAFFAAGEDTKHQPYASIEGTQATITVGLGTVSGNPDDKIHPTTASSDPLKAHFIERIYAVDQNDVVVAMTELTATTERPSLTFEVPAGTTSFRAFSFCNTHGLYVSEVYDVTATGAGAAMCAMADGCAANTVGVVDGVCVQHAVMVANSQRAQLDYFGSDVPFTAATSTKHTPYLTVEGSRGRVTVGLGTVTHSEADPIHPTTASSDPATVHFIELLYVKDQDGVVVAMRRLQGQEDFMEFAIPPTATSLTAYSHCNKHGLYVGAETAVEPTICALQSCIGNQQTANFAQGGGAVAPVGPATPEPPAACTPSDMDGFACMMDVSLAGASLHWSWDGASDTIDMAVRSQSLGWLGIAFTEKFGSMVPADAVVASEEGVQTYRLTQQGVEGVALDAGIEARMGLANAATRTEGAFTILTFTRKAAEFGGNVGINFARDLSNSKFGEHALDQMTPMIVNLQTGGASTLSVEDLTVYRRAHGWLMLISWIFLAPLGVVVKRYGKPIFGLGNSIKPSVGLGESFVAHLIFQLAVVASVLSAFALAQAKFKENNEPDLDKHNTVGYFLFAFMCLMPFVGVLMPLFAPVRGVPGRAQLKAVHANLGRALLVLAYYQVFSGIEKLKTFGMKEADTMRYVAIVGVAGFVFLFAVLEYIFRQYRVLPRGPDSKIENIDRLSWGDVRAHDTLETPWVVVDGRVYDVAAWLYTHPGGPQVLMQYAGKDGTDDFKNVGHSARAKKRMEKYYIGDLEDDRMVTAEDVAEEVTSSLVCLRLEYAEEALQEHKTLMPTKLHEAFDQLVKNIESYLPFLPPSLVAEVHDEVDGIEDEDEESDARTAITGRSGVKSASSGKSSVTGSRRSSMASRKMSGATSVQEAKRAAGVAQRANAIKPQKVTLMYVTAHFFESLATCDLGTYVKYHEFFLTTVFEHVVYNRGVVESFVGNRAVAAWNAFRPSATHSTKALAAMKAFFDDSSRFSSMMTCTAAAASGLVTLGTMGTSEMRRPTIMGSVVDRCMALERYLAMGGHSAVCDQTVYENGKLTNKMKLIMDRMHMEELALKADPRARLLDSAPEELCDAVKYAGDVPQPPTGQAKADVPTLVYEVVIEDTAAVAEEDDEWMYQMEGAACREWEDYNEAGRVALYLGQSEAAVNQLADSKPEHVAAFKEALAAGCTVDFRTTLLNSAGEPLPKHALRHAHSERVMVAVQDVSDSEMLPSGRRGRASNADAP